MVSALTGGLAGCGEAPTTRAGETLQATLTEELRIDPYARDLVPIPRLAVAEDGTMALLQPQDGLVRFFTEDGEFLGEVGGEGQGPGEFTSMFRVGWIADTLWVYDTRQRRLALISPEREFIRNVANPREARPATEDIGRIPAFNAGPPDGVLPDGSLIMMLEVPLEGEVPAAYVDHAAFARVSGDGVIRGVHHMLSLRGLQITTPQSSMGNPYSNLPRFAVSPVGESSAVALATLEGDSAGTYLLTVVDAEADTVFSRRYLFPSVPLPESVSDSVIGMMEDQARQFDPGLVAAIRQQIRVPPVYPPLAGIVAGRDSTVFVQLIDQGEVRPYHVIAGDGSLIGSVSLARNSRIAAGERERIWVIERDDLDVETVVRYRIAWED
jgi:hypothetical protein